MTEVSPPFTSPSKTPNVGIIAIEIYVPQRFVDQSSLEVFDGVSAGKYTTGLGQSKMGFCTDREDIHSLCLTVVHNLMEKLEARQPKISYDQIGRIEVGTETIIDKSKSVKSVIMQLFEKKSPNSTDIEGVDSTNACYGGTAALFNSLAWLESSAWDGRYALVVAGDIAAYAPGPARPTGGAGAVAILCGPNAPIRIDKGGLRASHSAHVYDFYKPDLALEYPRVDGKLSFQCYLQALDKCYQRFVKKAEERNRELISLEGFDAVVFHSPYCKLVRKSLARLLLNDLLLMINEKKDQEMKRYPSLVKYLKEKKISLEDSALDKELESKLIEESEQLFKSKTEASLLLANQVGNMYTASVFGGLVSYLISKGENELHGNRILMFSYGSGMQASLYSLRIVSEAESSSVGEGRTLSELLKGLEGLKVQLKSRVKMEPEQFTEILLAKEKTHNLAPYTPVGCTDDMLDGTYYLEEVDSMNRRKYTRKGSN